ncbi:hypothetical protein B0H63DRAFT_526756 [Podospora didyma]|uniref:Uncharacterized protein n=1 Tax=Podospora didyma TaxID=330526 RepID=A0AAE0N6A9_9PEZI|nr:hypothetical protein B0H63DRAFT_526756 [Podospora didyma]
MGKNPSDEMLATAGEKNYVGLESSIPALIWSRWSNDPDDMQLKTYFSDNPDGPGLAESFGLRRLRRIVTRLVSNLGDSFLVVDDRNNLYFWNILDGDLFSYKNVSLLKDAVEIVISDSWGADDVI